MSDTSTSTSNAIVAECTVLNLTPPSKVSTGICFLDHMIDQLTSHGQLGVALRCGIINAEPSSASGKRAAPEAPTNSSRRLRTMRPALIAGRTIATFSSPPVVRSVQD